MNRCEGLRRVLFLKSLGDGAISALAAAGFEKRFDAGTFLFHEGEVCLGLIVVLAGSVKVAKSDSRGREVTLGIERPGGSVGDLALFDGGTYPASAQARENETRVYIVPRPRFEHLMASHPQIAAGAVRALAVEQRKLIEMLKAQALYTVRARVAAHLLAVSQDTTVFPLDETNAAMGSRMGTVREVISRTLHSLEDDGAIRLQGRVVTILDRTLLRRTAEI